MSQVLDDRKGDTPLRNVRVDDELWAQAKRATQANDTNPSEVMRKALISYVKRHPVDDPAETGAH
jgi:predicted transcriptional regulator